MFLVNMYLKAFEHTMDIPDWAKLANTGLLLFSAPVFVLKTVRTNTKKRGRGAGGF